MASKLDDGGAESASGVRVPREMAGRVVEASAPGKVILFGEHSVVYGRRCIAAAIDRRTRVRVQRTAHQKGGGGAVLRVSALGDEVEIAGDEEVRSWADAVRAKTAFTDAVAVIIDVLKGIERDSRQEMRWEGVENGGEDDGSRFFRVDVCVESDLPAMRGMGSSASFAVAVSAALLVYFDLLTVPLDEAAVEQINETAFTAERRLHGNPSGIDNAVASFGGLVCQLDGKKERLRPDRTRLPLLVIDTQVPRSTSTVVAAVRQRLEIHTEATKRLLDAAGAIADEAYAYLQSPEREAFDCELVTDLMEMNQGLLEALGVGHAKVSEVVHICRSFGCRGVKITGAGAGGCLIALLQDRIDERLLHKALEDRGFSCLRVSTGCAGVMVEKT